MNWEKRRGAVVRCLELCERVDQYVTIVPQKYKAELDKVGKSMGRMIQLYGELDDRRIELESQVAELTTAAEKTKAPSKPRATRKGKQSAEKDE